MVVVEDDCWLLRLNSVPIVPPLVPVLTLLLVELEGRDRIA